MHNNHRSVTRLVRFTAVGVLAALLGACGGGGGGGGGGSGESAAGVSGAGGNNAPTLNGSPSANAKVGAPYTVSPTAQDADGDMLAFSIQNLPRWAQFNTATGQLSGTPAASDVGEYSNIVISVSDGKAQQSLPQFTVKVALAGADSGSGSGAGGRGVATLQWSPPQVGADKVAGWRIHFGKEEGSLTERIEVPNPGVLTHIIEDLSPGTYFFAIAAVNGLGLESPLSNVLTKTI